MTLTVSNLFYKVYLVKSDFFDLIIDSFNKDAEVKDLCYLKKDIFKISNLDEIKQEQTTKLFWMNAAKNPEEYKQNKQKVSNKLLDIIRRIINKNENKTNIYDITDVVLSISGFSNSLYSFDNKLVVRIAVDKFNIFKHQDLQNKDIEENDIILLTKTINDEEKLEFLGFVTAKIFSETYGGISNLTLGISSLEKILQSILIASNVAYVSQYESELFEGDINVLSSKFDGYDPRELFTKVLKYSLGLVEKDTLKSKTTYSIDIETLIKVNKFNIGWTIPFLLAQVTNLLQNKNIKWNEHFATFLVPPEFNVKNFVVYLQMIRNSWEPWYSLLETPASVLDSIRKSTLFEIYEERPCVLVCKIPEYNNLPKTAEQEIDPNYVIDKFDIISFNSEKNDLELKARKDTFFSIPFVGAVKDVAGASYVDYSVLLKYGFRTDPPMTNPNAKNLHLSTAFSALDLILNNFKAAQITITVPAKRDFKLGKLYAFPGISWATFAERDIKQLDLNKNQEKGLVGYLTKIETSYSYGEVPTHNLTFTYVREAIFTKENEKIKEAIFYELPSLNKLFTEPQIASILKQDMEDLVINTIDRRQFPCVEHDDYYYFVSPKAYLKAWSSLKKEKKPITGEKLYQKIITTIPQANRPPEIPEGFPEQFALSEIKDVTRNLEILKLKIKEKNEIMFKAFPTYIFMTPPQQELVNRFTILFITHFSKIVTTLQKGRNALIDLCTYSGSPYFDKTFREVYEGKIEDPGLNYQINLSKAFYDSLIYPENNKYNSARIAKKLYTDPTEQQEFIANDPRKKGLGIIFSIQMFYNTIFTEIAKAIKLRKISFEGVSTSEKDIFSAYTYFKRKFFNNDIFFTIDPSYIENPYIIGSNLSWYQKTKKRMSVKLQNNFGVIKIQITFNLYGERIRPETIYIIEAETLFIKESTLKEPNMLKYTDDINGTLISQQEYKNWTK